MTVPTVNGMFPGPPIEVNEGDRVIVKVTNKQVYPATLHWYVCPFLVSFLNHLERGFDHGIVVFLSRTLNPRYCTEGSVPV